MYCGRKESMSVKRVNVVKKRDYPEIKEIENHFQISDEGEVGLAIGIVSSGWGLGGLVVPLVTKLVDVLQWRTAMIIVGLGI